MKNAPQPPSRAEPVYLKENDSRVLKNASSLVLIMSLLLIDLFSYNARLHLFFYTRTKNIDTGVQSKKSGQCGRFLPP